MIKGKREGKREEKRKEKKGGILFFLKKNLFLSSIISILNLIFAKSPFNKNVYKA